MFQSMNSRRHTLEFNLHERVIRQLEVEHGDIGICTVSWHLYDRFMQSYTHKSLFCLLLSLIKNKSCCISMKNVECWTRLPHPLSLSVLSYYYYVVAVQLKSMYV